MEVGYAALGAPAALGGTTVVVVPPEPAGGETTVVEPFEQMSGVTVIVPADTSGEATEPLVRTATLAPDRWSSFMYSLRSMSLTRAVSAAGFALRMKK